MNMSLYEINEIISIQVKSQEVFQLLSSGSTVCVISGCHIHLLKQSNGELSETAIEFENNLVKAGLSSNGCLLVAGDSSGVLHFLCPSTDLVFNSQKLLKEDVEEFQAIEFTSTSDEGNCKLFVLTSIGTLHVFRNIQINKLTHGLMSSDIACMKEVQSMIDLKRLDLALSHHRVSSLAVHEDFVISCGEGNQRLCVWIEGRDKEDPDYILYNETTMMLEGTTITKCSLTSDGSMLIALTDTQSLAVLLVEVLVMVNVFVGRGVTQFDLLPRGDNQTDLICCVCTAGSEQTCQFEILTLPNFSPIYVLPVQQSFCLSRGCLSEDGVYFSEVSDTCSLEESIDTSSSSLVESSNIMIKRLVQTQPKDKLAKLLSEQKFNEAFRFANEYGLDIQLIYREKAQVINTQLCAVENQEKEDKYLVELINTLDNIEDTFFVCELVLNSAYPSLLCTRKLLQYSGGMVDKSLNTDKDKSQNTELYSIKVKLCISLDKLVTYHMIHDGSYSASSWRNFIESSLLSEFIKYVQMGDLHHASFIWSRHQMELKSKIDGNALIGLLHSVPESVSSSDLGIWLKDDVLPCMLCHFSEQMVSFTSWLTDRIQRLELTEQTTWPSNAIQLLDLVIKYITTNKEWEEHFGIQAKQCITLQESRSSIVATLVELQKQLENLKYVKTQLVLSLSFSEYCKESRESVIFILLDKVLASEVIPGLLQTKIIPYSDHHSLCVDKVLLHYIKHMLPRVPRLTPDSSWEAKAITVVQSIKNKKLYVEGCIELLKGVPTHWSNAVEGLVQDCLSLELPCVQNLQKQHKLLQLRRMLYDYGVQNFNFSHTNTTSAWKYVRYVLKQPSDTVLQDALKIAELYLLNKREVYVFHLVNLGSADKSWKIPDILESLGGDDALRVATETTYFMMTKLGYDFNEELDSITEWKASILVGIECFKFMSSHGVKDTFEGDEVDEMINLLQRIKSLQNEFNLYIQPRRLQDSSCCELLLKEKLSSLVPTSHERFHLSSTCFLKYMRYGKLLGYSDIHLYLNLADTCLAKGQIQEAKKYFNYVNLEILTDNQKEIVVTVLVSMVMKIWDKLGNQDEVVSSIEREDIEWMGLLAANMVRLCPSDQILYYLEVHALCRFIKSVWSQCIGGFDTNQKFSSVIDLGLFTEDGLVLEMATILPLVVEYSKKRLHYMKSHMTQQPGHMTSQPTPVGESFLDYALKIVNHFEENSQTQLALDIAVQSLMANQMFSSVSKTADNVTPVAMTKVIDDLKNTLTSKVLSARKLDHDYGLALLLQSPPEDGKKRIIDTRVHSLSSYTRVKSFCKLGIDYGILNNQSDVVQTCEFYYRAAEWGKTLMKYEVSFTQAFRGGSKEKKEVLYKMLQIPSIDLNTICDYCRDFRFHLQEALLTYIKALLVQWPDGYHDRLKRVVELVDDQKKLYNLLTYLLMNKISPYDYARIKAVLQLLNNSEIQGDVPVEKGLRLLECLSRHTRQGPVSSTEKEWMAKWSELNKIQNVLGEESSNGWKTRLPFHPLMRRSLVVQILSMELSKESLGRLMPICSILQISPDDVLEESIVNIVKNRTTTLTFNEVASLVGCIETPPKALEVCKWLAVELEHHDRIESVKSLEAAVKIAESWKLSAKPEELNQAKKTCELYNKYLQIKQTEQLLQEYDVHDEELTTLSAQPAQLLMQMYFKLTSSKTQVISVHEFAAKIGSIWNLNLPKIRRTLAEQWLPVLSSANRDMDITQLSMMEDPTAPDNEEEDDEEEMILRRLSYLLKVPEEIPDNTKYLINWARSSMVAGGAHSRVRAFHVVFAIAPVEMIEQISGSSVTNIREYMQLVLFVSELEDLHMKTTINTFRSCNKEGLIRTLWKNHSHEPKAIRLICELCVHYNIHDHILWSRILEQLLRLNMILYLRYILKTLSQLPLIYKIPNISEIWYKTLITPLKEVSLPPTAYQIKECSKSLKLLQTCPFVYELDIIGLAKSFQSIGMLSQSIACVLLLPDIQERDTVLKEIIADLNNKEKKVLLEESKLVVGPCHSLDVLLSQD